MANYTRDEIIEAAKKAANEISGPLTLPDFERLSGITKRHIQRVFPESGWTEAKRLAGLVRHPYAKASLSDETLLREFHRVASDLGRIPSWAIFSARSDVTSDQTISKRFGGRQRTLKRYKQWLEENEPTSPLLGQLQTKSGRKAISRGLPSTKKSKSIGKVPDSSSYVDGNRLNELRAIKSENFDFTKLIRLCEELNESYIIGSYFGVAMMVRAILDHVPPIFECKSFAQITSNYSEGTKSFKQSMAHLENSSRKIADAHLHSQIRKKEVLPNKTQVNFMSDLDVLLAEIVRILK